MCTIQTVAHIKPDKIMKTIQLKPKTIKVHCFKTAFVCMWKRYINNMLRVQNKNYININEIYVAF